MFQHTSLRTDKNNFEEESRKSNYTCVLHSGMPHIQTPFRTSVAGTAQSIKVHTEPKHIIVSFRILHGCDVTTKNPLANDHPFSLRSLSHPSVSRNVDREHELSNPVPCLWSSSFAVLTSFQEKGQNPVISVQDAAQSKAPY